MTKYRLVIAELDPFFGPWVTIAALLTDGEQVRVVLAPVDHPFLRFSQDCLKAHADFDQLNLGPQCRLGKPMDAPWGLDEAEEWLKRGFAKQHDEQHRHEKSTTIKLAKSNEWWAKVDMTYPRPFGLSEYSDWLTIPSGLLPDFVNVGDEFELIVRPAKRQ